MDFTLSVTKVDFLPFLIYLSMSFAFHAKIFVLTWQNCCCFAQLREESADQLSYSAVAKLALKAAADTVINKKFVNAELKSQKIRETLFTLQLHGAELLSFWQKIQKWEIVNFQVQLWKFIVLQVCRVWRREKKCPKGGKMLANVRSIDHDRRRSWERNEVHEVTKQ